MSAYPLKLLDQIRAVFLGTIAGSPPATRKTLQVWRAACERLQHNQDLKGLTLPDL